MEYDVHGFVVCIHLKHVISTINEPNVESQAIDCEESANG